MKMLKVIGVVGFLLIQSQLFSMESVLSFTGRVGQVAGQLTEVGSAALGVLPSQNGGAGDPLQVKDQPLDLKKVLLRGALEQKSLINTVRKIGQLRKVCKNWDALLHDERILRYLVPRLFYDGGIGEVLISRSLAPAVRFALKSMINDTFVADLRVLQSMGNLLKAPLVNSPQEHLSGMVLLYGPHGVGKTSLACLLAKNRRLEPKCFNVSTLKQYSLDEASGVIATFFDTKEPSIILIDVLENLSQHLQPLLVNHTRGQIYSLFLKSLARASENNACILCTFYANGIPQYLLEKCSVSEHVTSPSPEARRVILQLYVDCLVQEGYTVEEGAFSDSFLDVISRKLDGFTGKEIEQLVFNIKTRASWITRDIINGIVEDSIRVKQEMVAFSASERQ